MHCNFSGVHHHASVRLPGGPVLYGPGYVCVYYLYLLKPHCEGTFGGGGDVF